jgi:hypothetical protein
VIPGLRSLRSHKHPTRDARVGTPLRGSNHAAAPRLVDADIYIDAVFELAYLHRTQPNNSLGGTGTKQ